MSQALCISALSSNQGKTILTTALLWYFRNSVRPYKIGPDFIDPQFHTKVCNTPSINLDSFIMSDAQVKWIYNNYATKDISILEGVMGFYDGDDRGCSAYSVSKLLNIPTILIIDGSGSYITISALLKGMLEYKSDNTIAGVVLNKLSSSMHYKLIKKQLLQDHPHIKVLGWIEKNLPTLSDTHLGLDLQELSKIEVISQEVLKHIDMPTLIELSHQATKPKLFSYPFEKIDKLDKKLAIVHDKNFSFLYYDNLLFLQEIFKDVAVVDATKDEVIPNDSDIVYIPGGYVETPQAYDRIKNSHNFKSSLQQHSKTKPIYAECAGLLYLSKRVENMEFSGILDIEFKLGKRFNRLGYYYNEKKVKGHAFHYTYPTDKTLLKGFDILKKRASTKGEVGSWKQGKVFGTYLHTMFRAYPDKFIL